MIAFVVDFQRCGIEPVRVSKTEPTKGGQMFFGRGKWDKRGKWFSSIECFESLDAAQAALISSMSRRIEQVENMRFDEVHFLVLQGDCETAGNG